MNNVTIYLKSGEHLTMKCKNFTATTTLGKLTGIKYEGAVHPVPLYLDIDQVVAIIDEGTIPEEQEAIKA